MEEGTRAGDGFDFALREAVIARLYEIALAAVAIVNSEGTSFPTSTTGLEGLIDKVCSRMHLPRTSVAVAADTPSALHSGVEFAVSLGEDSGDLILYGRLPDDSMTFITIRADGTANPRGRGVTAAF